MKTVEAVDKEIGQVQRLLAKLEADRAKNAELLQMARGIREENALAALAGSDGPAHDKLVKARSDQRSLEFELEDVAAAVAQANRQLEQLKTERSESYRVECWQKFQALSAKAINDAGSFDAALSTMTMLLKEHNEMLSQMTALCAASGRPRIFSLKHARRFLEAALHKINSAEFSNQDKAYRSGSYEQFLAAQIDGAGNSTNEAAEHNDEQQQAS
jgi:hypothetical protein